MTTKNCPNRKENLENCNCTYDCDKKGICCECLRYHLSRNEVPACFFNKEDEKTYNRTIEFFKTTFR